MKKVENAKKNGYNVVIIWEKDWNSKQNKKEYLEQVIL